MRDAASTQLDKVDLMAPGTGAFDGYLFGRGDLDAGVFGLGAEYNRRVSKQTSIFGRGAAGYSYSRNEDSRMSYSGLLGVRWRF